MNNVVSDSCSVGKSLKLTGWMSSVEIVITDSRVRADG